MDAKRFDVIYDEIAEFTVEQWEFLLELVRQKNNALRDENREAAAQRAFEKGND